MLSGAPRPGYCSGMLSELRGPRRRTFLALLTAALVLLGQAVLGPAAFRSAAAAPPEGAFICHTPGPGGGPAQPDGQGTACGLCAACHALGTAAVLPPPVPGYPVPQAVIRFGAGWPASHPPVRPIRVATYPTGPPRVA